MIEKNLKMVFSVLTFYRNIKGFRYQFKSTQTEFLTNIPLPTVKIADVALVSLISEINI